ncbi:MAG: glycine--tRNA ligase subunit beta [bacterium]|nr:glycine--tRNA ligase subunit beta [bacterium]
MSKYLLEIGVEELPYKFMPSAIEQLDAGFRTFLKENDISFENIKIMATPRRLAVLLDGLNEYGADMEKVIKGPIASVAFDENKNLTKAGEGFAKKNNINPNDLYIQDNYVYAKSIIKGKDTKTLLQENVPLIFSKLQGAHFMRWGSNDVKFSRPIRWVLSLFDNEVIKLTIIDKEASNITNGHRFSKQNIVINSPDEYVAKLKEAHVIVDQNERKQKIIELTDIEAKKLNATTKISDDLLEEVTFICEYPIAVTCNFDEEFLTIPQEVAVTVMETHQRYFALYNKDNGKLINKFITITNYIGSNFENIKAGNLRVIKARLDDAVFFFNEDTKKPLESYIENLKGMTFQKNMGSVYDKTQRIIKLSEKMNSSDKIKRTAELCKADLATNLVFEFTELQGFIGADYARISGEAAEVCEGIKEHYFPLNADGETAKTTEGQIVGIADKIDTISAVFASGKKPTGSSDPLGVRRAALGVIKIILEHNLKIDISELIKYSLELLPVKADCQKEIEEFFIQRLIIFLNNDYKKEVLDACASKNPCHDLCDYLSRVKVVSTINDSALFENANRVLRILKEDINGKPSEQLFSYEAEKDLYKSVSSLNFNGDYNNYLNSLINLNSTVSKFFEDVLVMDKDEKIKNNRLALLSELKNKYIMLTDFSKLSV